MIRHLKFLGLTAAVIVGLAACGSSDGSSESKDTTTTSADSQDIEVSTKYMESGPNFVGVATLALPNGDGVEVWYPTATEPTGQVTYDVRDFVPDALKTLLTGDVPATYSIDATRDAPVAEGTFPVVLFSHGFAGMRLQSSFLTSHLASWGMVVISPDHAVRDLKHAFVGQIGDSSQAVTDLFDALDATSADPRFANALDLAHVAAVGHSAGGGTVLRAASDDRVLGYVSLASGELGGTSTESTSMPNKPSFFIAGSLDQVVSPTEVTEVAYTKAPSPSIYWLIDGVGHNGFDDFCTFGGGKGIIGVAEASGLGAVLDAQPQFRKLGSDGCEPPAVSSTIAFPVIRQAVTAWLTDLFSGNLEDPSLNAVAMGTYQIEVTVQSK